MDDWRRGGQWSAGDCRSRRTASRCRDSRREHARHERSRGGASDSARCGRPILIVSVNEPPDAARRRRRGRQRFCLEGRRRQDARRGGAHDRQSTDVFSAARGPSVGGRRRSRSGRRAHVAQRCSHAARERGARASGGRPDQTGRSPRLSASASRLRRRTGRASCASSIFIR